MGPSIGPRRHPWTGGHISGDRSLGHTHDVFRQAVTALARVLGLAGKARTSEWRPSIRGAAKSHGPQNEASGVGIGQPGRRFVRSKYHTTPQNMAGRVRKTGHGGGRRVTPYTLLDV